MCNIEYGSASTHLIEAARIGDIPPPHSADSEYGAKYKAYVLLDHEQDKAFEVCMGSARRSTEANDAYRSVMDEAIRKEMARLKIKKCEKGSDGKVSVEKGIAYVDRMFEVEAKILKEK